MGSRSTPIFVKAVVEKELDLYQEDDVLDAAMVELGLEKKDDKFDYLLSMQARSFTKKKVDELEKEIEKVKAKIVTLKKKTEKVMWLEDLDEFDKAYATFLKTRKEEADPKLVRAGRKAKLRAAGTKTTGAKTGRKLSKAVATAVKSKGPVKPRAKVAVKKVAIKKVTKKAVKAAKKK